MQPLHVLILGGGYGGLACLRALAPHIRRGQYRVTLVDATPHHTIKTRFHERAVWENRELLLRLPLAALCRASGAEFVRTRVHGLDLDGCLVSGERGELRYDRLVLALGGSIAHFGVPGAAEHTVSLQTYPDTCACAARLGALGAGERGVPRRRVVVCGAGVEGLEVAAMVRQRCAAEHCQVTVVERSDALMARSQCRERERAYLARYLERQQIDLRLGSVIEAIEPHAVLLQSGERLASDLVYWCAGVRRVEVLGTAPGAEFRVNQYLQAENHPEVFALGDFVSVDSPEPFANLASAQRAVYQGALAGQNLWRYDHLRLLRPARYRPIGELIGLGDRDGVGLVYGVGVSGKAAAALKKGNEAKYLAEVGRGLPRSLLRRLLGGRG